MAGESLSGPAGIWTLDGQALVAGDSDGPATVLVPSEAVRLLAVDLPLASPAKRLAALPFAIEDLLAEPVETLHLAIGVELAPRRYLVAAVAHDRMAEWIARIEEGGLIHAALVPDCLALPRPPVGEWAVEAGASRALVRRGDGTGFAIQTALLPTAWAADARPAVTAYGAPLPAGMGEGGEVLALDPLHRRLLVPALDLRQGLYARRRASVAGFGKRLAQIAAVGALAHAGIAAADTLALRRVADSRVQEVRALVLEKAPGTVLPDDDPAAAVADLLPQGQGGGGGSNAFLPVVARASAALQGVQPPVGVREMRFSNAVLTIEFAGGDSGTAARIDNALRGAGLRASVVPGEGGIRATVQP